MSETIVTRRHALQTGGLAAIMAGLLGTATTPAVAAEPALLIDRAEALLLEVAEILSQMGERDQNNVGQVLVELGYAAGLRADLIGDAIDQALTYIGPGRRVMDQIFGDHSAG